VPRRLEAEPLRDAVLAVSGRLNRAIGGPSVRPSIDKAVLVGQSRLGDGWEVSDPMAWPRRSVYDHVKRTLRMPELAVMDAADTNDMCPGRDVTTTPQALTWLNGAFMAEQAGHFANRLRREVGDDPARQVDRGFALALNRDPTDAERRTSLEFLDAQARRIGRRPRPEERADTRRDFPHDDPEDPPRLAGVETGLAVEALGGCCGRPTGGSPSGLGSQASRHQVRGSRRGRRLLHFPDLQAGRVDLRGQDDHPQLDDGPPNKVRLVLPRQDRDGPAAAGAVGLEPTAPAAKAARCSASISGVVMSGCNPFCASQLAFIAAAKASRSPRSSASFPRTAARARSSKLPQCRSASLITF
jgi:hypothetical protein